MTTKPLTEKPELPPIKGVGNDGDGGPLLLRAYHVWHYTGCGHYVVGSQTWSSESGAQGHQGSEYESSGLCSRCQRDQAHLRKIGRGKLAINLSYPDGTVVRVTLYKQLLHDLAYRAKTAQSGRAQLADGYLMAQVITKGGN